MNMLSVMIGRRACCPDAFLDALAFHVLRHAGVVVVLADVQRQRLAAPLRGQLVGHRGLALLAAAAVADEDDVLEAVRLQALGNVGEQHLIRLFTRGDGAGEVMWPLFGSMPPSGTNFTIGAHKALPILRAMASQFACST